MSHWESGLERKIELKTAEYHRKLARLVELSKKAAHELVIDTAKRFAGAARNAMPPDEGKTRLQPESGKREIIDIADPETWESVRFGKVNRNAHFGPNKYNFVVLFRKRPKGGRKTKYFHAEQEAKQFQFIKNRGAARYGWAQATVALGGAAPRVTPAGFPFAKEAKRLMDVAGSTEMSENADMPRVEIENHSTAAGPMHLMKSKEKGLWKAVDGLNRGIKAAEKEMEANF